MATPFADWVHDPRAGALLRAILDNPSAGIYVKDRAGRYLLISRSAAQFLETDAQAALGRTDDELFAAGQALRLGSFARQTCERDRAVETEIRFRRRDGVRTYRRIERPVVEADGGEPVICGVLTDITETHRAEEEREATHRKYVALVDSIDAIVHELDGETLRFLFVSPRAERLLGYPLAAWFAEPNVWINKLHPDDRDRVIDFVASQVRSRRDYTFEYRIIAADERVVWLRNVMTAHVEDDGVVRLRGVMIDISENKRAEESLRDSQRRLELAVEAADIHLWEFDLVTHTISPDPRFVAAFGYAPGEIKPTFYGGWASLVHPDDLPLLEDALESHIAGRTPAVRAEFRMRKKNGRWRWISARSKAVAHSPEGRPLRIAGTALDITERKRAENALRESEQRFRAAFEQAAVGMGHFSATACWTRINRRFCDMLGYEPAELIGHHYSEFTHADDQASCAELVARLANNVQDAVQAEKRWLRKDGSVLWAQMTISSIRDDDGALRYYSAVCVDVTERKLGEQRLLETQAQLRLAAEIAKLGFWQHDLLTNQVYYSPEWKKQLGYEDAELPNRYEEFESRLHPDDRGRVLAALAHFRHAPTPEMELEFRLRHRDGSHRFILARAIVLCDAKGQAVKLTATHFDITERKEAEVRIRQASQHDALTGLPNRGLIYEFGEHLLAGLRRGDGKAAVMFVDLDRFKPINDTYGHDVGDKVLQEVGRRLHECVRSEDLVGRFGGDEFVAVISHLNDEGSPMRVARGILEHLCCAYQIDGLTLHLSPSVGIALYPEDGSSMDELIKNADSAMFHAKEGGRNRYQFFRPELNEKTSESMRIESRLKHGLEAREFELHYQPVIDNVSQSLAGVEALIRWPAMNVQPERFIPVAETSGFMQTLGAWVIDEACRQQREWRRQGMPRFPVAINVSPLQFHQKDFLAKVCDAMDECELGACDMQLEVTESAVMKNVEEAASTLHALRAKGIKVALDDFGTGYSSLSQLRWLPIDILKVDQSFVKNMRQDAASLAIADAIIALGNTLGLEIIAEGIESEATAELLRDRHCRFGQGFHYCRPMPAAQFEAWYRQHYH